MAKRGRKIKIKYDNKKEAHNAKERARWQSNKELLFILSNHIPGGYNKEPVRNTLNRTRLYYTGLKFLKLILAGHVIIDEGLSSFPSAPIHKAPISENRKVYSRTPKNMRSDFHKRPHVIRINSPKEVSNNLVRSF